MCYANVSMLQSLKNCLFLTKNISMSGAILYSSVFDLTSLKTAARLTLSNDLTDTVELC